MTCSGKNSGHVKLHHLETRSWHAAASIFLSLSKKKWKGKKTFIVAPWQRIEIAALKSLIPLLSFFYFIRLRCPGEEKTVWPLLEPRGESGSHAMGGGHGCYAWIVISMAPKENKSVTVGCSERGKKKECNLEGARKKGYIDCELYYVALSLTLSCLSSS